MSNPSPDKQPFQLSSFSSSFSRRVTSEPIECPECRKHTIVKRAPNVYDCINCGFHKELPPVAPRSLARYASRQYDPTRLDSPATDLLPDLNLITLDYPSHQLRSPIASIPTLDPNHPHLELEEGVPEADKIQPLVFAAIAVIFGIIFL
ncbi:MAG: hypothetical protein AAFU53_11465 [Cyanobacteria bacterium J06632_3]